MNSVIRLHRRPRKAPDPRLIVPEESEADCARQLAAYALAFTGCALVMYTAAVLAVWDSSGEIIWLLWLVFVIAFSKLLLANGFLIAVLRADRKAHAELAAQQEKARRVARWRANLRLRLLWREPGPSRGPGKVRLVQNPAPRSTPER